MRHLVLSDIHANREALEAVLEDARGRRWDRILVLGDVVGYGADPDAAIDILRELAPHQIVRGNHDKVVSGISSGEFFNPLAFASATWTRCVIRDENRQWLEDLPQGPLEAVEDPQVVLSHGSPVDEEEYILGREDARLTFEHSQFGRCLFGHTHYPVVIGLLNEGLDIVSPPSPEGGDVELLADRRYLINPGSIGQPRDGNPWASYVILDTTADRVEFYRVPYRVEMAMARIVEAGLPAPLAARLARGI